MKVGSPVFIVCGGPGSGKDSLIQAVKDMGAFHAAIVPKHTSRRRRDEDGTEMICPGDHGWNLHNCELLYQNHEDEYGIEIKKMWDRVHQRISQVVVVSSPEAINALSSIFGQLVILIYVHSDIDVHRFVNSTSQRELDDDLYLARRARGYNKAFDLYVKNMTKFNHVVIYSGSQEDMFDQLFRIFRYYESL